MIRVLLVDDSRVVREVTKVYLIGKDVSVMDARNGQDALRLIGDSRPDVVVADMRMPMLDGPGLCEALRSNAAFATIPVIILTSNADQRARERCFTAGAREVLTKPVDPANLMASIRRQISPESGFPLR